MHIHIYILPYFERRYLYIIIYTCICIYDDIFYNIYTTFTIYYYIVDFRSATWLPYEYWSVADTDTRSAPIFWVARFFFLWRLITFRIERVTDLFGYTPGGSACRKSWLTIPGHGDIVRRKYTVILN